jgi:hypothetical protein
MSSIRQFRSIFRGLAVGSAALFFTFATIAPSRAATCDGQKGTVIFEDSFADDSGGWVSDPNAKFGVDGLTLQLDPKWTDWTFLNTTFNASDGDYCAEVVVPKPVGPDNATMASVAFWVEDYNNLYMWSASSDGTSGLYRKANGKWTTVADGLTAPNAPAAPGSVVALRVQAAGNLIVASVNGIELKRVRAPMPAGKLQFGLYLQTADKNPAPGMVYNVKRFKITDGK